jgi:hypothetical protein
MDEAETIFKDSEYRSHLIEQNLIDKNNSFQNVTLPDWYTAKGCQFQQQFYMTIIELKFNFSEKNFW